MRVSALSLLDTVGARKLAVLSGLPEEEVVSYVHAVHGNVELLPAGENQKIDTAMARAATDLAMERHAGTLETAWTPMGAMYIQHGKDLTKVPYLVGTGGVIVNHPNPGEILQGALYKQEQPTVLRPQKPRMMLDKDYILAAVGLLAEVKPTAALKLAKKYMVEI